MDDFAVSDAPVLAADVRLRYAAQMSLNVTLALTAAFLTLGVFAGWRGGRPPNPHSGPRMIPWRMIMLLSAAAMGTISLILLAIVWRTRRFKPPRGYMAFAIFVAAAPIIALAGRLMT